jgi:hypothetical protein
VVAQPAEALVLVGERALPVGVAVDLDLALASMNGT